MMEEQKIKMDGRKEGKEDREALEIKTPNP